MKPLAIALQGIGYGSLLTAVQGFSDVIGKHMPAGGRGRRQKYNPAFWAPSATPWQDPQIVAAPRRRKEEEVLLLAM